MALIDTGARPTAADGASGQVACGSRIAGLDTQSAILKATIAGLYAIMVPATCLL